MSLDLEAQWRAEMREHGIPEHKITELWVAGQKAARSGSSVRSCGSRKIAEADPHASEQGDSTDAHGVPLAVPLAVRRPVRLYRLEIELIQAGDWQDVQAKVWDLMDDEWPGRQIAVDLVEETLLVPDGRGKEGSRS